MSIVTEIKKTRKVIALCNCNNQTAAGCCVIHHANGDFTNPDELEEGYPYYCQHKVEQCFDLYQTTGLTKAQKLCYLKQALSWTDKLIADIEKQTSPKLPLP